MVQLFITILIWRNKTMRVPTPSEAAFLAITAGVATVSTAIIAPEIHEDLQEQVELAAQSSTPQNDFNNGFVAGLGTAAIVGATIYNKAKDNP